MAKKYVKMAVYAEPGVGKSTFASKAPNVFFVTTDGNFQWLDLPEEQHVEISNWNQFCKVNELLATEDFDWCETVVVDLLEDVYRLCEDDFCNKNKIQFIGDLDWGKGYNIVKKDFDIEMSRLINLPKNIIFLLHGFDDTSTKDARGNTKTKHVPSNRIPDKVLDVIEGKLRYFLRAYIKSEMSSDPNDERQIKKRYLSLVPKANEYGIARGLDESTCPHDIELDWNVFADVIGLNEDSTPQRTGKTALQALIDGIKPSASTRPSAKPATATTATGLPKATGVPSTSTASATVAKPTIAKTETTAKTEAPKEEVKTVEEVKEKPKVSDSSKAELLAKMKAKKAVTETTSANVEEAFTEEKPPFPTEEVKEEVKQVEEVKEEAKPTATTEKKVANPSDISAKLAALKAARKK